MANIFTKRGTEAKESLEQKNVDLKKVYIRLKEDDSVRVRVLGIEDYVEYLSHGDFNLGIYTQPCTLPIGQPCAFDEALEIVNPLDDEHELADFKRLYPKKRYVFALADIDTGEIRVWDASKNQAKGLIKQIEEYAEDIDEVAFNFKRTGTGRDTAYSLNPILRLKGDDQEKFHKFDGVEVDDSIFNAVLVPRSYEQQVESLKSAGFPVELLKGKVGEEDTEYSQDSETGQGEDPTKEF
jgi:hypothetical protein